MSLSLQQESIDSGHSAVYDALLVFFQTKKEERTLNSPYKQILEGFLNTDDVVVINRAGATDLTGIVDEVDDGGCTIKQPCEDLEKKNFVFVAFEDIRGVGCEKWDLNNT